MYMEVELSKLTPLHTETPLLNLSVYTHSLLTPTLRTKPLQPVTLSLEQIEEYEAAFKAVDVDKDGHIDVSELGGKSLCNL